MRLISSYSFWKLTLYNIHAVTILYEYQRREQSPYTFSFPPVDVPRLPSWSWFYACCIGMQTRGLQESMNNEYRMTVGGGGDEFAARMFANVSRAIVVVQLIFTDNLDALSNVLMSTVYDISRIFPKTARNWRTFPLLLTYWETESPRYECRTSNKLRILNVRTRNTRGEGEGGSGTIRIRDIPRCQCETL